MKISPLLHFQKKKLTNHVDEQSRGPRRIIQPAKEAVNQSTSAKESGTEIPGTKRDAQPPQALSRGPLFGNVVVSFLNHNNIIHCEMDSTDTQLIHDLSAGDVD